MNWDAVSAVADWAGVVLVVFSLAYLALQIRQNTKTVRAATELDTGRQWSEFHSRVAHSSDMADIWDKGLTNSKELSPPEKRKLIWLVAEYFFLVESLYRQRQLGFLGHDVWEQHQSVVTGLLCHPMLDSWWESGVSPYSTEFREAINKARLTVGDKS
jgi:hypothetical protein